MDAIRLQSPGLFERVVIPEPRAPGPGEALVGVHRVAICGTDISGYLGKMPLFSYPRIPGHELGVEVLMLGEGVEGLAVGDRCSVEPYLNCGTCVACRRGRPNCCSELTVLGVHIDGGLRRRFVLPARKLHPARGLSDDQLALVETLAIGCHAVARAAVSAGDRVLVVGAGPIGLSVVEFAVLAGAEVTVLDVNPHRLEFCRELMGIERVVGGGEGLLPRLEELTGGDLFATVIDATGNARSMAESLRYVSHAGQLVYVGITSEDIVFPHRLLHTRETSLLASRNALPEDFERIIRLIENGDLDTSPWVTHRTTFDELIGVFESYARPETGVVKAIIELS